MASSWIEVPADSDFSLANIPFGVASIANEFSPRPFCATAIGNSVVNLGVLQDAGAFDSIENLLPDTFHQPNLNKFLEQPPNVWPRVRARIVELLEKDKDDFLRDNSALQSACIYDRSKVQMHLPIKIGEYTDFYSSREHATNVGTMFRGKENALQPNWLHLPVGYHGRASTVVVSGTPIRRPYGQLQKDKDDPKQGSVFGPCRLLDFELEVASIVGGPANPMGKPLTMEEAKERIFGFLLMNDWSARDIQKWEYVPLGPFTAKNFGTTLSPWIVTTEALQDFTGTTSAGPQQTEPVPLDYLQDPNYSSYNINLQVEIQGEGMAEPYTVCKSNFLNLYWNAAQQLVHHSVSGCVMNPGDLLGSGTISGQDDTAFGSMLELSWKGTKEVPVGSEVRKFLKDGDTVIMKGWCTKADNGPRVGFGDCSGKVLPAMAPSDFPHQPNTANSNEAPSRYEDLKLYSYWRSSSSWRVRIALNAKGLAYEVIPIDLKQGSQKDPSFLAKNPMGQVPVLEYTNTVTGEVHCLTQSVAILDFLDAVAPNKKSLTPTNPMDRVAALEMVELINSGIQPLQNAPMVKKLEKTSEGKILATEFAHEHIARGLNGLEQLVVKRRRTKTGYGPFCMGSFSPTIVDVFLVPQLYNARRWGIDTVKDYPALVEIESVCAKHPWFESAHAENQIDAEK